MADIQQEQDHYASLGLELVSRNGDGQIAVISRSFNNALRKIRVVQLVTAAALIFFLLTDMLPTLAVLASAAVVFSAVILLQKKLLKNSTSEVESVLATINFGSDEGIFEDFKKDPVFVQSLLDSRIYVSGEHLVNAEDDSLALCRKIVS